jgi:hypothetical protein
MRIGASYLCHYFLDHSARYVYAAAGSPEAPQGPAPTSFDPSVTMILIHAPESILSIPKDVDQRDCSRGWA